MPTNVGTPVQSSGTATTTITSFSYTLTQASGTKRAVVVAVRSVQDKPSSVTFNGVTMLSSTDYEYASGQAGGGTDYWVKLYYLLDASLPAAAGSYAITGSFPASNDYKIAAFELSDVSQVAPEASSKGGRDAGATFLDAPSLTTLTDNAMVIVFAGVSNSSASLTFTEDTTTTPGLTALVDMTATGTANIRAKVSYVTKTPAGSLTPGYDFSENASFGSITAVAFVHEAAAAASTKPYYHRLSALGGLGSGL